MYSSSEDGTGSGSGKGWSLNPLLKVGTLLSLAGASNPYFPNPPQANGISSKFKSWWKIL